MTAKVIGGKKRASASNTGIIPVLELEGKLVPARGDALDRFLNSLDNPDYWRTLPGGGPNGEDVTLTSEEVELIRRIQEGEYGDTTYDPYEPYVDFFTGTVLDGTVRTLTTEPKRRHLPSKWEAIKVQKLVAAIRQGRIKLPSSSSEQDTNNVGDEAVYDMWDGETDASILARRARYIEAPRLPLPHHRESYRPPIEYLLAEEERAKWEAQDPEDRPHDFLPQRYNALRLVPGWENAIRDRFRRCLDLFLCPRTIKNKIQLANPDDLLPELPDPQDLRPFPTTRSIDFVGHTPGTPITALSVDPTGRWLLSAGHNNVSMTSDTTEYQSEVRLWDTQTGHCQWQWVWEGKVTSLAWNPNPQYFCFALALETSLYIVIPPGLAVTDDAVSALRKLVNSQVQDDEDSAKLISVLKWKIRSKLDSNGVLYSIKHTALITKVVWHRRGDYLASLSPDSPTTTLALVVHQLSSQCSQSPFRKVPGPLRTLSFHPTRPYLAIATAKSVRLYDLARRELLKRLIPGVTSISDLAIHSSGDHLVVTSHDGKAIWFDLDYAVHRPYRSLFNHQGAIRAIDMHPTYPLMSTVGDDGVIQVIHATVYSDFSADPLLVPVKSIKDFATTTPKTSVQQVVFHPAQPWLFAATSHGAIALFV